MREFLSRRSVAYEERNVARRPDWRAELVALVGDVVVPTTVSPSGGHVVGFDAEALSRLAGLSPAQSASTWRGLDDAGTSALPRAPATDVARALARLRERIQREMEYNAAKGSGAYREGQHDALRFARDAIDAVLNGTYDAADLLADQARRDGR